MQKHKYTLLFSPSKTRHVNLLPISIHATRILDRRDHERLSRASSIPIPTLSMIATYMDRYPYMLTAIHPSVQPSVHTFLCMQSGYIYTHTHKHTRILYFVDSWPFLQFQTLLSFFFSAMKIHITQETKDILDELGGFITDCRGFVEIKVSSLTP